MRNNNKLTVLILVAIGIYLILDLLLHDTFLYTIGGLLGALLKPFDKQVNLSLLIFLWIGLLISSVVAFYKLQNKPLKYLMLVIVAILLYVVDFILYEFLNFDREDVKINYLNTVIIIIAKGLILALIIYVEIKRKLLKTKENGVISMKRKKVNGDDVIIPKRLRYLLLAVAISYLVWILFFKKGLQREDFPFFRP